MAQHGAANVPHDALVSTGDEFPGEDHQIDAAALFDQLATGVDGVAEPVWPLSGEGEMLQQQFHTPPLPGRIVGTDTVILPALGFCGTPGCKLRDRHPGLCSSLEVRSFRTRTPKVMGDAERWEMPSSGRSSGAAVEGRVASTQPTKLVGAKRGRVDTTTSENVSPASRVEADPSQPLSSPLSSPLSIAAKEALRQAKAEGLTLLRSESSNTGFMNVTFGHVSSDGRDCAYSARIRHGGKQVVLGVFDTAEEAALCVARALAAMAASPEPLSPAAEEALQPAQAENLTAAATLVEAKTEEMVPALPEDAVVVTTDAAAPAAFEAVAEEPRSLERELLTPLWLYVDASGSEQGPFAAWQVAAWYQASQLPPTTMIRHVSDRTRQYRPLSTVPQLGGVAPSAGAAGGGEGGGGEGGGLEYASTEEARRLDRLLGPGAAHYAAAADIGAGDVAGAAGHHPAATVLAPGALAPGQYKDYAVTGGFSSTTGRFTPQDMAGDNYWKSKGIPNDRAGRLMNHFFDVDAYQEQMNARKAGRSSKKARTG